MVLLVFQTISWICSLIYSVAGEVWPDILSLLPPQPPPGKAEAEFTTVTTCSSVSAISHFCSIALSNPLYTNVCVCAINELNDELSEIHSSRCGLS